MHIEQCNVKYEIKSMKTLEDTISYSWLVLATIPELNVDKHFHLSGVFYAQFFLEESLTKMEAILFVNQIYTKLSYQIFFFFGGGGGGQ